MNVGPALFDFRAAQEVVRGAIRQGTIPGAVALVRHRGQTIWQEAAGWAALEPEPRPMRTNTIFDLASLTKVLVTAPLTLQLATEGAIALDDPVAHFLPAMRSFAGGQVTIRQLLTHSSGLSAWESLYVWARTRAEVLPTIARLEPAYIPGTRVIYSCLGYIVLGLLIEQLTGSALDVVASRRLFTPLGLRDTGFGPVSNRGLCAWTEHGNASEERTVSLAGHTFAGWRREYLAGEVHDGNAWYALGGISGNAGSFATAQDVADMGQMWLDGDTRGNGGSLSEHLVREATANQTPDLDEARGLGWQINQPGVGVSGTPTPPPPSAGTRLSPRAFGHTGFTGTSIWIDPDLDLVAVLLTNRIHPRVDERTPITAVRRAFHDAVAAAVRGARVSGHGRS